MILSTRPSVDKIHESLQYCLDHGINKDELFVPHDGEVFSDNVFDWDEQSYSMQVGKIENNFSRERLAHVTKMADRLFGKENRKKAEFKEQQRQEQQKNRNNKQDDQSLFKAGMIVGAGIIGVGVVLALLFA